MIEIGDVLSSRGAPDPSQMHAQSAAYKLMHQRRSGMLCSRAFLSPWRTLWHCFGTSLLVRTKMRKGP